MIGGKRRAAGGNIYTNNNMHSLGMVCHSPLRPAKALKYMMPTIAVLAATFKPRFVLFGAAWVV